MTILKLLLLLGSLSVSAYANEAPDYAFQSVSLKNARSKEFPDLNHRTWANNTVAWWYNPDQQPFSEEQAVLAITQAAQAWQNISGVKFVYQGITHQNLSNTPDDKLVIGWLDAQTFVKRFGNYSGYSSVWWLDKLIDGEISLNLSDTRMTGSITNFQAIMTHEFGHILGLAHSDEPGSILYVPYHTYEYQLTLRTDDVNAARKLYPCPACGDWQRVLNWAESNYPSLFKASNKQTVAAAPNNSERFYPETQTYLGYNLTGDYFYGASAQLWGAQTVKFGALNDYLKLAIQAGY